MQAETSRADVDKMVRGQQKKLGERLKEGHITWRDMILDERIKY